MACLPSCSDACVWMSEHASKPTERCLDKSSKRLFGVSPEKHGGTPIGINHGSPVKG